MKNNKLATQSQLFNFQGKEFTVILINDELHWIAKEICDYLELSNTSVSLRSLKEGTQKKHVVGEILSQLKELPNLNLGSRTSELNLLTEAGVYKLIFKSRKPNAEDFTDWISEDVLPTLRKTGKYDSIEEKLKLIEDDKERELSLGLYSLQQALKVNPNDYSLAILVNQKEQELTLHIQNKKLELVQNGIEELDSKIKKATVLREGDKSAKNVAEYFKVYSKNHKPHNQFADKVAKELGFYINPTGNAGYQDEHISINLTNIGGTTVSEIKYSKRAIELMEKYIYTYGLEVEAKYGKRGINKGKFIKGEMIFKNGEHIFVNEDTYNFYHLRRNLPYVTKGVQLHI
ncbi:BRO-N domain-containing protein [Clostridium botulinum]|uniref:BRO-N domain-containing protein n=1 Tax=Clostridium botulinum TaxID=1491 RepID=UPI0004DA0D63|nr:BRO family protein [Clostridium botulinum]KEH96448.1 prophage antirepressor [Clostridium botulinum D str. 16868]